MERKEPFWSYLTYSCLVAAMNLAGILIADIAALVVSAPLPSLYHALAEGGVATSLALVWAGLAIGFVCGARLTRSVSAIAVPVGCILAGLLVYLELGREHWFDRRDTWPTLLIPLIVIPALAALSARHGSKWATRRNREDLLWLICMLLAFALLFWFNQELFGLIPDPLRQRMFSWHL